MKWRPFSHAPFDIFRSKGFWVSCILLSIVFSVFLAHAPDERSAEKYVFLFFAAGMPIVIFCALYTKKAGVWPPLLMSFAACLIGLAAFYLDRIGMTPDQFRKFVMITILEFVGVMIALIFLAALVHSCMRPRPKTKISSRL